MRIPFGPFEPYITSTISNQSPICIPSGMLFFLFSLLRIRRRVTPVSRKYYFVRHTEVPGCLIVSFLFSELNNAPNERWYLQRRDFGVVAKMYRVSLDKRRFYENTDKSVFGTCTRGIKHVVLSRDKIVAPAAKGGGKNRESRSRTLARTRAFDRPRESWFMQWC